MKNKVLVVICAIIFTVTMLAGCGGNDNPAANTDASEVGQEDIDKLIRDVLVVPDRLSSGEQDSCSALAMFCRASSICSFAGMVDSCR